MQNSRRCGCVESSKQVKLVTPEKWTAVAPGSSPGSADLRHWILAKRADILMGLAKPVPEGIIKNSKVTTSLTE